MHALADFPLQGEYLAHFKARKHSKTPGDWVIALSAHSLIHAGGIWLLTGSAAYAFAEFILHVIIDFLKGEDYYGLVTDQILHLSCKVVYVVLLTQVFS